MGEERLEHLKGRAKEAAGDLTEDKDLQREGKLDQASASVKEKAKRGVDKVKDTLKGDDDR